MTRIREQPIFIYHQSCDYPVEQMHYGVTLAAICSHLDTLKELNLEGIPLEKMLAQIKRNAPFSPRAVTFTFDGGFRDAYDNVFPNLNERGVKAAISSLLTTWGNRTAFIARIFPAWTETRQKSSKSRG